MRKFSKKEIKKMEDIIFLSCNGINTNSDIYIVGLCCLMNKLEKKNLDLIDEMLYQYDLGNFGEVVRLSKKWCKNG